MAYAKHIIKKQIIELQIPDSLNRRDIQNRVSDVCRAKILPLLDKLLTDKSASATLVIDRLDIDLGNIPESRLEEVLTEKINLALQEQLDNIQPAPTTGNTVSEQLLAIRGENHSNEELVIYFLQTGLFPWWAKETTGHYLETAFRYTLAEQDTGFKSRLAVLIQENEEARNRLIYSCSDELLSIVAAQLASVSLPDLLSQKQLVFALFSGLVQGDLLHELWWTSWYKALASTAARSQNEIMIKAGGLFINQATQKSDLAALFSFLKEDEKRKILEQINTSGNHYFISQIQKQLQDEIIKWEQHSEAESANNTEIFPVKKQEKNDKLPSEKLTGEEKALPGSEIAKADDANTNTKLSSAKKNIPQNKLSQLSFSGIDKIYIQNAGLILLWPFLHRFFQNMGLADEKMFTEESSAERACLLLQYLVTGSTEEIFEAQLPLNKLLCGIPLLQPAPTNWTINEEEKEIASNFLLSVIRNGGEGWKNLTVNGLQQAYLNREGIISGRDGNWLLQVQRETYDILLDRLPWTIQVVKMPWMPRLLFAEWQLL